MIFTFLILITLGIVLKIVHQHFKPFIEFSKNNKHFSGFSLMVLKVGYEDFYEKVMSKAACYDSLWMGNQFTVILNKPEDIQIALNSEKCFEKSSIYKLTFKYGLLTEGGEKYKDQRKSLKPLFSIQNLKNQIPKINEKFKYFLDKNSHFIECKGTPFEMQDFLSKFTLNTVMLTMFGIENHLSDDEIIELMEITNNFLKLSAERVSNPLLHLDLMFKLSGKKKRKITVLNRFWQIFTQHFLDKIQRKENKQPSYFECMEPHTIKMDQEELMETVVGFLGASFESTMVSISSILFLLASNPDKQEKLFDEVSSVLSSHEDEVTESIMNEMSYLDLVIKESLRLIPVGILIGRTATDDIEFTSFTEPNGSVFLIPVLEVHRNKSIWGEDAMEFKPERFEPENFKKIHPYAYIPFSGGARMCPGYKYAMITMKIFISRFIMKYRVTTDMKYEDLEFIFKITSDFKKWPLFSMHKRE